MRVSIRSQEVNLWIPIPLSMAGAVVRFMPESAITEINKSLPPSCQFVVTRKLLRYIIRDCRSVLKQYKGLEIINVQAKDGTHVSIRL